ncbi:alkaline phosphatase family protein [Neobacillus soli]|uniref:alkaline phosphatase family protein n=1 Tax=Neobacillus soli TaxID=220688 RepID=UPI001F31768F|nr:alkaline phosphatase family protein [Neobacillus soli]
MLKKWGIILVCGMFILSACTQNQSPKKEPMEPVENRLKVKGLPKIDHIVIVVEENHSHQEIQDNPSAPYMNSLMNQGANLTNYYAIEHPSQPNYLDLFSGSNQGVTNDEVPKVKFSTANLGSELIDRKYSFGGYSEDLPSIGFNGPLAGDGGYARKHNPWVNFTNVPKEVNQPLTNFPKDFNQLATVSFVIPNLQNDMHDGTIQEADQWLKKHMDAYVQWAKTHNSLLIVTWDEDDNSQNNKIPTFFVGPMVKTGQFTKDYNHFNLLRTIEDIYGLSHAGKSQAAEAINVVWD